MDANTLVNLVLGVLYVLAIVAVVFVLVTDDRDPSTVLAWLFVLALLPVVGFVAYMFLGRNYRRSSRLRHREEIVTRDEQRVLATVAAPSSGLAVRADAASEPSARVARVALSEAKAAVVGADTVKVYFHGADKFHDLLEDLASAEHTITLMYLIWERDELTAKVTQILLDRMDAGVQVFIMYDWLGSISYPKSELRRLRRAGAKVLPCYRRLLRANYRNHMKVADIDGRVVYTGGMNMGSEYADGGKRFAEWRDTHLRMTGPVIAPLQALTAGVWRLNGRPENLLEPEFLPANNAPSADAIPVQAVYSSVWTDHSSNRDMFITALGSADRRVWIQSPYLVPDEPLLTAMCTAAASGIDVRFMMAGVYDKSIPWWVAHTYYLPLLDAGVRVFQYQAGFLHSKTVTVDDDLTIVGTCNWDIRSLILHDEVSMAIHDADFTSAHAAQYETDLTKCREITPEYMAAIPAWQRYRNSFFRLTSRLL